MTDTPRYSLDASYPDGPKAMKSFNLRSASSGHMTPGEFREYGRQVIDWIADYYEHLESYPVLSPVAPGDIRAALPRDPPEQGEPFEDLLRDLDDIVRPGITHWQHPSFFAYFPANTSGPAILGDLLASGLGVQGML
jgi:aromatic-L-amino-acid/L-tryptophan decarboxylase